MADEKESKGVEQPPFDPNKLLAQLEGLIQRKSKEADPPARVGKSSIWSILLPLVVLIGIAVFAWVNQRRNRELAKLRHEKNKAIILKAQAHLESELAGGQVKIAETEKRIVAADEKIRVIEADIRAEGARYEADRCAIDRMRGWDGSYVRKG